MRHGKAGPGPRWYDTPVLAFLALLAASCGGGGEHGGGSLPRWSDATTLALASSHSMPQAVIDARGVATVAWMNLDGRTSAARGSTASGWTAAVDFEPTLSVPFARPMPLAVAGSQTVATWINHVSPNDFVVRASAFDATWLPADTLTSTDFAGDFAIAGSDDGSLLAVWVEFDGAAYRVVSSRKSGSGPWVTVGTVSSSTSSSPSWPVAAVNSQGECVALWLQDSRVVAAKLAPGSGAWTLPMEIENSEGAFGVQPKVVALRDGRFAAAWLQTVDGRWNVYGSSLTASGWQRATLLEHDDRGDAGSVHLTREGPGTARAVWLQTDGGSASTIHTSRFGAQGWDASSRAVVPLVPNLMRYGPRVVSDRLGNTLVAWQARPFGAGLSRIEYTYQPVGAAEWLTPGYLSGAEVGPSTSPALAMDDDGNAVVAWNALDGARTTTVVRLLQP